MLLFIFCLIGLSALIFGYLLHAVLSPYPSAMQQMGMGILSALGFYTPSYMGNWGSSALYQGYIGGNGPPWFFGALGTMLQARLLGHDIVD